jgi:tetratricopeptide (TPR) repeat protein
MRGVVLSVGILLCTPFGCAPPAAAQTPADSAWERGDLVRAEELYSARLAADSTDLRALHRLGLIRAWSERHEQGLALLDRLLAIDPRNVEAAVDRARVLAWRGDPQAAVRALDLVLEHRPDHLPAREARAQFAAWAGEYEVAQAAYRGILAEDPQNLEALRGLARIASWRGDLIAGEARWRRSLANAPDDVPSLVGLAQTLRWQGRNAAALRVLERAVELDPTDRDARTQLQWTRAALAPRFAPFFVYENDSDGNRIATTSSGASWHPLPRLELRGDGYVRNAEQSGGSNPGRWAQGIFFTISGQLEPGWILSGGVGASGSDVAGAQAIGAFHAAASTPTRGRIGGTLAYSRGALDATARLIERRVRIHEWTLSGRATPGPGWTASASLGRAALVGTEPNHRISGNASILYRLSRPLRMGFAIRAFGFQRDLNDGYFDPDFYGIGEVNARWLHEIGPWTLLAEVAPGLQQVGKSGSPSGAVRANGHLAYRMAPGREVGLSAAYSTTGLNSFSTGEVDYRYRSLGVFGSWTL